MIEGPRGPSASRGPLRRFSAERLLEQVRGRITSVGQWVLPPQHVGAAADGVLWRLHIAERVLWMVLAVLGFYLVIDILFVNRRPPVLVLQTMPANATASGTSATVSTDGPLKSSADYRQVLVGRNPFGLSAPEVIVSQAATSKLDAFAKTLTVVGINRSRVPEALIEDSAAQRTYVVKVGDQVNGATVKAIDQRGVLLNYEHQEIRLQ